MRRKLLFLLVLFLTSAQIGFSQTVKIEKSGELSPEQVKEAAAFLRETAAEVGTLRTLENRISFSSEMAGLMWFADEKEARSMYQTVINDFRQLLTRYDAQANAAGEESGEENYTPSLFGGGGNNAARKLVKALNVRQQIASGLAEHDARLALEFFTSSAQAVTNQKIRKQIEEGDAYFEANLLAQAAAQNVDTALEYGRKMLAKKFNYQLIEVLQKIYEKEADKGAAFGEDIVAKLKSETETTGERLYALTTLFNKGAASLDASKEKPGKKPMFGEQSMREIADLLVKEFLKGNETEGSGALGLVGQIEKFSPAGAARIRQKFGSLKEITAVDTMSAGTAMMSGASMRTVVPPRGAAGSLAGGAPDSRKQLTEDLQSLGAKQLPKEEREKIIAQSRKTIAAIKDPNQKLLALSALAAQIAALGDKESAAQIMDEARLLVTSQPKNYAEFMQVWMLAGSYAQVDAPKAFPILEDAILRLNETIGGAIKVAEFIDVGGDILEDGEVQIGGFGGGGGSMARELMRGLGASDATIRSLAKTDFARTKNLTNKFDRAEVRILAKMLVLRSMLGSNKETEANQTFGAEMAEP